MIQIFNTLSREKEPFKPLKQEIVKIYSCGPTPYNFAHIGNMRAYLFEDLVIRTIEYAGYKTQTVMNITDIDDKTIRDSQANNISRDELTQKYTQAFLSDLDLLNIHRAHDIVPISTLVDEMVTMIQWLIDKGYAYLADDGSIYYSVDKFANYGKLAHIDRSNLISGVRIKNDEYSKDQASDFALWKWYDISDGPNFWEPIFRINDTEVKLKWRPGWHIECSACNLKYLGEQIDIHMGAVDNIFPHHQNEIAQTESYTGKTFSKYWLHAGHLLVDNKKMAKSAGNFYTLQDIIQEWAKLGLDAKMVARSFRLMTLQSLYRDNFNFGFDRLVSCAATIRSFDDFFRRLQRTDFPTGKVRRNFSSNLQAVIQDYSECIFDDFRSNDALVSVHEAIGYFQREIDMGSLNLSEKNAIVSLFETLDSVLGIFDFSLLEWEDISDEIRLLAESRCEAKKEKRYSDADTIRQSIEELGYRVIDTTTGYSIEKI